MIPCPSRKVLHRFLDGHLGSEEEETIRVHVNACPACQRYLDGLTGFEPEPDDAPDDAEVPPTIAGFTDLIRLGRGGMGVVYRAMQVPPGRPVALKLIRGDDGPRERQRLRTEAEVIARLRHPHIVAIHLVGECDAGLYLALEFCEGGSLKGRLDGTPWPASSAAKLVEHIARAMQHAHASGVVHRDVKPSNVLFAAEGTAKVADFGLALLLDAPAGLSRTGDLLGTPAYMAPEQTSGSAPVGPAADVYSLGVVLYELLTGRVPFKGVTDWHTITLARSREPVAVRVVQSGVPQDLETICLKCLEKEPQRRYATAGDLADDLDRFLTGAPVRARPISPFWRAGKWLRRHPATAILIASAAALVLVGLAGFAIHTQRLEAVNRKLAEGNRRLRRTAYVDAIRRVAILLDQCDASGALRLLAEWEPQNGEEDLRGWEWHYLRNRIGRGQLARWDVGVVYALALSPDGRTLAGGGPDGRLRVWNPETGRELAPARQHPDDVNAVAWAPDGTWLATACDDGVVRIWPRDGGPAAELVGHADKAKALAVAADGRTLVSAGMDAVRIWDVTTRSARHVLAQPVAVCAVAVDDAASTVVAGVGNRLMVWDAATGRPAAEFVDLGMPAPITVVRISPGGDLLVCASILGGVICERAPDGQRWRFRSRLPGISGHVGDLAFGRDGRTIVSASDSGVTLWETDEPKRLGDARGHDGRVHAVAVFPDGRRLATAAADGTIRVWNLERIADAYERPTEAMAVIRTGVQSLFWLSGRPALVTCAEQTGSIVAWDGGSGRPQTLGIPSADGPFTLAAAGPTLFAADALGRVFRWNESRWADLGFAVTRSSPPPNDEQPCRMAADPAGRRLAVIAGPDILLVDAATGRRLATLSGHRRSINALTFAPDGAMLASVGTGGRVCLWDVASARLLTTPTGHTGPVHAAAFTPDGTLLATAGLDRVIRLWDLAGRKVKRFVGHRAAVDGLAFAPDGRTLASASDDGTVRLWQTDTGGELLTLATLNGAVFHVAFSPDGRYLATAANSGTPKGREFVQIRDAGQPLNTLARPGTIPAGD